MQHKVRINFPMLLTNSIPIYPQCHWIYSSLMPILKIGYNNNIRLVTSSRLSWINFTDNSINKNRKGSRTRIPLMQASSGIKNISTIVANYKP